MVAALARGDHRYVLRTAEMALEAAKDDLPLLARVHTWIAQAHARAGDTDAAREQLVLAVRAVKQAGDEEGLRQIRALRRQVLAQARAASEPPPGLAASLPPPPEDTPLGRALAALAQGDEARALTEATHAREDARRAGDAKAEVLALLALARLPGHADSSLRAARDVADLADDQNLIAAVAAQARQLGVDLGVMVF